MSDLHLESQSFGWSLPRGDILIVAGDLCHAVCLGPGRQDAYAKAQRDRVQVFIDKACSSFAHVLLVLGNHDHYDGVFEDTASLVRKHLPGVTLLDDEAVEIDGVRFFGSTLWSDFEGRSATSMTACRRGAGEFFFVRTRAPGPSGEAELVRFSPEHALASHDRAVAALRAFGASHSKAPAVVITHHAPSRKGLNPFFAGNGLDGAYASDLDDLVAEIEAAHWVHGHTHIKRRYRVGDAVVHVNCRGFDKGRIAGPAFSPGSFFDL